jgi:hypothetical protein
LLTLNTFLVMLVLFGFASGCFAIWSYKEPEGFRTGLADQWIGNPRNCCA